MIGNSLENQINLNVRGLPVSATLAINEKSLELRRSGRKVYRLGLGQSPFPVPDPVVEVLRARAHEKDYLPVKGLYALREAVADYHRRTQGIEASADDVLIAPGSKELMFLLQLVFYGDLLIPTPSWVSYAPQAHIIGRHVRWLSTHRDNDWHLMPDELDRHCSQDPGKPRILILNYPSNPTGRTYSEEELRGLAEVARRHQVVLLSDEIYGELHHHGKHQSIARYYPEGTIISSGLSKWCGAGGWRLGTFLFPPGLRKLQSAMAVVASETYTSTSAPIQYAAVRAFRGGIEIERYLVHSRRILDALGTAMTTRMKEAGILVSDPHGAFYLFPDFSNFADNLNGAGITTSEQLCDRLLEDTGVAVLPGSVFGRPPHEMTMRIAYVDFDGAQALAAAEALAPGTPINGDFLKSWCGEMLEASERICKWISDPANYAGGFVS
jgi:aspartate aminotransferase